MADYYGSPYISGKFGITQMQANNITNISPTTIPNPPTVTTMERSSLVYGGSVGYQFDGYNGFSIPIRFEGEYLYRSLVDYDDNPIVVTGINALSSNLYTQTILGNIFLDIPVTEMFQFFVGGGGGLSNARTHSKIYDIATGALLETSITDRDAASWMASAGINVKPLKWIAVELSYRYSDLGSVRWTSAGTNDDLQSNNFIANEVFLGVRLIAPSSEKPPAAQRYQATEYVAPAPVKEQNYVPVKNNTNERARRQKAAGDVKADK
jgi:opacity protein-like surface antigen